MNARVPVLSLLFEPHRLIITTRKQSPAHARGIDTIVKDNVQAPELANIGQLSSGRNHGAAPQIKDRNGGDSGAERARYWQRRATTNSCHRRLLGAGYVQEGSCLPAPGF